VINFHPKYAYIFLQAIIVKKNSKARNKSERKIAKQEINQKE